MKGYNIHQCYLQLSPLCLCLLFFSLHLSLYWLCAVWQISRDRQSWFSAGTPLMPDFVGHGVWVGVSREPGASRWKRWMREPICFNADLFPAGLHRRTEINRIIKGSVTVLQVIEKKNLWGCEL